MYKIIEKLWISSNNLDHARIQYAPFPNIYMYTMYQILLVLE